jgi:hypothetical protein
LTIVAFLSTVTTLLTKATIVVFRCSLMNPWGHATPYRLSQARSRCRANHAHDWYPLSDDEADG